MSLGTRCPVVQNEVALPAGTVNVKPRIRGIPCQSSGAARHVSCQRLIPTGSSSILVPGNPVTRQLITKCTESTKVSKDETLDAILEFAHLEVQQQPEHMLRELVNFDLRTLRVLRGRYCFCCSGAQESPRDQAVPAAVPLAKSTARSLISGERINSDFFVRA